MNQLGTMVRQARLARGLSQTRLARAVGLTPQYISDIERGRAFGSYRTLQRLAARLELSLDSLLSANPDKAGRHRGMPGGNG
ncbi:MAG: helix-turn-helix domain-containing protein [Bacillota bacterium]